MKLRLGAVLVSTLLVLSMVTPLVGLSAAQTDDTGDDRFVTVGENDELTVWERSVLPLRVDPSNGETQVDNMQTFLGSSESVDFTGNAPLGKSKVAVYNDDTTLNIDFASRTGADLDQFEAENREFDLLAAKIEDADEVNLPSGLDFNEMQQLLLEDDPNVEFEVAKQSQALEGGSVEFSYDLSQTERGSGVYVFFAVESGEFDVTDGNVDVTGSSGSVFGVDLAVAQQASSTAELQNQNPSVGDQLNFDVSSNLAIDSDDEDGDEIDHVVMVYDEEQLRNTRQDIILEEEPSRDFSSGDVTIEHELESVDGVSSTEKLALLGRSIAQRDINGVVELDDIISFVSQEAGAEEPGTTLVGDETLYASVTAVSDENPSTTVSVDTLDRWDSGEYQVVHLAMGQGEDQMSTSKTTVDLEPSDVFEINTIGVDTSNVEVGDTLGANIEIENTGGDAGTQEVDVTLDGESVSTGLQQDDLSEGPVELSLEPGEAKTIYAEFTLTEAGAFELAVETDDDTQSKTIEVGEPAEFDIQIDEASSKLDVLNGQDAEIEITATNVGDVPGDIDLDTILDSENQQLGTSVQASDETISFSSIDGGESATKTIKIETPGPDSVSIDGQAAVDVGFYDASTEQPSSVADADASTTVTVREREDGSYLTVDSVDVTDADGTAPFGYDVIEGNTARITADVTDIGKEPGEQTVELYVDGESEPYTDTVAISERDGTGKVTFEIPTEVGDAPTLDISIEPENGNTATRTIDLASVSDYQVDVTGDDAQREVFTGQTAELTFVVENIGDVSDTKTVSFDGSADLGLPDDLEVSLDSGDLTERTVSITAPAQVEGTEEFPVDILVDGETKTTTTLTVNERPEDALFETEITEVSSEGSEPPSEFDVIAGDSVSVTADVENVGGNGERDVSLRVDGQEVATESIQLDSDGTTSVTFENVDVGAGDSASIEVDTGDDSDSTTINIAQPATFNVDIRGFSDTSIIAGQTAALWVEVENLGDVDASSETLAVSSEEGHPFGSLTDATFSVDSGQSTYQRIQLPTNPEASSAGDYTVTAAAGTAEDSTIVSVGEPEPAFFDVGINEIRDDVSATADSEAEVDVNVENIGTQSDTQTIEFVVDGEVVEERSVELGPETVSSTTETFTYSFQSSDSADLPVTVRSDDATVSDTISFNEPAEFSTSIVSIDEINADDTEFGMDVLVTNTGDDSGSFDLNALLNGENADSLTIDGKDSLPITLDGGESGQVSLTVTDSSLTAGSLVVETEVVNQASSEVDDRSVRRTSVGASPDFQVDITDVNEPIAGDDTDGTLEITAEITNEGDDIDRQDIDARLDGARIDRVADLQLGSGETETVTFERETRITDAGDARVSIGTDDDSASETTRIRAPASFDVEIDDVTEEPVSGESLSVDATIENLGDVSETETVELRVGDSTVATESQSVAGGETETVTLEYEPAESGDAELTVAGSDDSATESVEVLAPGEAEFELRSVTNPVTRDEEALVTRLRVSNVGDTEIQLGADSFTLELNGETVPFDVLVDGETTSDLTVSGQSSETVVLRTTNTVDVESGNADLTVALDDVGETTEEIEVLEAPEEAYFRLDSFNVQDDSLLLGDETALLAGATETTVSATTTNIGDESDTQTIELSVGGEVIDEVEVTLDGGETETGQFTITQDDIPDGETGNVTIQVVSDDSERSETIDVQEADDAQLELTDVSIPETATQGDVLEATIKVTNVGDETFEDATIGLDYDDGVASQDSPETSIFGGETITATIGITIPEEARAGEFERSVEVSVNGDEITETESVSVDFEDIQSGVDVAEGSRTTDTVMVADNTVYTTPVTVTRGGIEITSTGQATIDQGNSPAINIREGADDVTISGFELIGIGAGDAIRIRGDDVTVEDVRIANWNTAIDSQGDGHSLFGIQAEDVETGIEVTGDGTEIAYSRLVDVDDTAIDIEALDATVRTTRVLSSGTGVNIDGTATIQANEVRNNELGIVVAGIPDSVPAGTVAVTATQNNLEANDVDVRSLLNPHYVDATENWWGQVGGAEEGDVVATNDEYIESGEAATEPYDDANYNVDATAVDTVAYGDTLSVDATILNDGDFEGRQSIGLVVDNTVVDTTETLEINQGADEQVTLTYDTTELAPDVGAVDVEVVSEDDSEAFSTNVDSPAEFAVTAENIPDTVEAGDTISVDVGIENVGEQTATQDITLTVDGEQVDSESVELGGSSSDTRTLTYETNSDDIGTLDLVIASDDTETTATVTVEEADDDTSSGSSGGGRASDPTSGSEVEVIDDLDEIDAPEDIRPTRAERAQITVDEGTGQARVTFTEDSTTESITFNDTGLEGDVTVAEYDTEPEETGPSPGASVSVTQITVPDPDASATIRTRVTTERLAEIDADADDLRVNRFADGEWQSLDTEIVDETDERVVLEAETPGFSYFSVSAVSEPEAAIDAPAEVEIGEEVTLDGSQSSDRYGDIVAYEWDVGGETHTGETVTTALDTAGDVTVELTVENDAGETATETTTISVLEDGSDPGQDPDPGTETDPDPESDDGLGAGLVIGLVLFIVVVVAAVLYMRQNGDIEALLNR